MADPAPAGAAADPQALIAKHAAKTQTGAEADAAIVTKVEAQIANSPMGWLQGVLGDQRLRVRSGTGGGRVGHGGLLQALVLLVSSSARRRARLTSSIILLKRSRPMRSRSDSTRRSNIGRTPSPWTWRSAW